MTRPPQLVVRDGGASQPRTPSQRRVTGSDSHPIRNRGHDGSVDGSSYPFTGPNPPKAVWWLPIAQ